MDVFQWYLKEDQENLEEVEVVLILDLSAVQEDWNLRVLIKKIKSEKGNIKTYEQ